MILWDADGVLFDTFDGNGAFRWAATVGPDLGLDEACVRDIFSGEWRDVLRGLKTEEDHVADVFERRGIDLAPRAFLSYWLSRDMFVNEALWPYLNPVNACIATNQSLARTEGIEELFGPRVRAVYASCRMGVMKPASLFFSKIERDLGRPPETLCLIDDTPENVEAALQRGWRGHVYTGPEALASFLKGA